MSAGAVNWTWVVAIEGVTLTGETQPTGFSTVAWPGPDDPATGVYEPVLVPGSVRVSESAINPIAGDPPSQSLSFDLILTDDVFGALFARPEAIGVLASPVAVTDTSLTVTVPTGTLEDVVPSGVLYIGREAFCGVASGNTWIFGDVMYDGALYPVGVLDRAVDGASGRLGHLYTTIRPHGVRSGTPPWPNDLVYMANPTLRGRRVFLFRAGRNAAGEWVEQLFGQYRIATELTTNAAGTIVSVRADSLVGAAQSAQFWTNPQRYTLTAGQWFTGVDDPPISRYQVTGTRLPALSSSYLRGQAVDSIIVPMAVGDSGLIASAQSFGTALAPFAGYMSTLFEQAPGGARTSAEGYILQRRFGFANGVPEVTEDDVVQRKQVTFTELLVSDPELTEQRTEHPFWDGSVVQQNPLLMVLQHLGERASGLSSQWVYRLGPDAVDVAGIETLAILYAQAQFPGVVAGGDGRPVPALRWMADTYLRPIGCGWGVNQFGQLTVRSLFFPATSPTDVTLANALEGRALRRSLQAAANAVRIDARRLTINGLGSFLPDPDDEASAVYAIDGSALVAGDNADDESTLLARPGIVLARAVATSLGEYLRGGPLQAVVTVTSASVSAFDPALIQDLLPGQLVTMTLTGLRGRNNKLIQALIVSHKWANDYTSQDIRVLLTDVSLVRWSAAVEIDTVTDNTDGTYTLTFATDDTIRPTPYDGYATDLETLQDQHDLGGFDLLLCDATLAAVETVSFNGIDMIFSVSTPAPGQWLTLSDLGTNPGTAAEGLFGFAGRDRFGL